MLLAKLGATLLLLAAPTEALRADGQPMSRRAFAARSLAAVVPLVPMASFADLKKPADASVYAAADAGELNAARAIVRAKQGLLVDGSSATCFELDALLDIDREAIQFETDRIGARYGKEKSTVQETSDTLLEQVERLKKIRKKKGCLRASKMNLNQASDFEVYNRADDGLLNRARVIERAKAGKLVEGTGASCSEIEKIIAIDKKAVQFEKDKLAALGPEADPGELKIISDAQKAIVKQVAKLADVQKSKGCVL